MNQASSEGSSIELELVSGHLLFIDLLYFQKIIQELDAFRHIQLDDVIQFTRMIEEKIFPYGGGKLLGYKKVASTSGVYHFDLHNLKYNFQNDEVLERQSFNKEITAFSTDSGTFLIIDFENFHALLNLISYDDIINAYFGNRIEVYISNVNQQLGNKGWGFIISPGMDKGYAFEGSGSFVLEEKHVS